MNYFKKNIVITSLLVILFSFIENGEKKSELKLSLKDVNVIEVLNKQKNECRPSTNFMFFVETRLVKKSRGSNTISADVFVLDRNTGYYNLIATENILVPVYKDAISLEEDSVLSDCGKLTLENGDVIVGSLKKAPYCFSELIQFEAIYNSYEISKEELLTLKEL